MKERAIMRKFTVLDLFSGAGGLSRGFMDAGYEILCGVDFDDAALKTFKHNHNNAEAIKLDLFNLDNIQVLEDFISKQNVKLDVLVGGPPCQGFSLAGPRDENDERNKLYLAMVETAKRLKPKVVVLENVPGLVQLQEGKAAERIVEDLENIGYTVSYKILYAPDYGVPQIRKRVFFVGILHGNEPFEYPLPTTIEQNYVTVEQAISDLPALEGIYGEEVQEYLVGPQSEYQTTMREFSDKIYNHIGTIHSEKTVKMISLVPEGKNYKALPEKYRSMYKYNEALTRYHSKRPSLTINTGHRSHFHYKHNRIPTVRESARLQSFTDDFLFFGNKTEQYRQVGNAVPPLLGKALATQIKKYLEIQDEQN